MIFEQILIGGDRNFAYLIGCEATGVAAVVDPSYDPDRLVDLAGTRGLRITHLFNTHGHGDHTNGNVQLVAATGANVAAHPGCPVAKDLALAHDAVVPVGRLEVRCLYTPGHSADSVTLVVGGCALTGDTLFVGKVGGTHNDEDARREYASLHEVLMALPDDVGVYPGHHVGVRPSSTIGDERRTNPFLLQPTIEAFLDLKRNWPAYKKAHGIA